MMEQSVVDTVLNRFNALVEARSEWDQSWQDVARVCFPISINFGGTATGDMNRTVRGPRTQGRVDKIYDSTAMFAAQRFSAALESMATPRSAKWHGLANGAAYAFDDTNDGYFEKIRDLLFQYRYRAGSGFANAIQEVYTSLGVFGQGCIFVEDGMAVGSKHPITYRSVHLANLYVDQNAFGVIDAAFHRFNLTARQALQRFKERCPEKIKMAARDDRDSMKMFEFIHAVIPNDDPSYDVKNSVKGADFKFLVVCVDEKAVCAQGGYYEMPYVFFRLNRQPSAIYAESPAMMVLPEIKSISAVARDILQASQQRVRPAFAAYKRQGNKIDLNGGKINYGMLDPRTGRPLIQPIVTGADPMAGIPVREDMRNTIRESFFINLFQVLADNPNMTATEAMIRDREKGEMLGPVGAKIQDALSLLIDRELSIHTRNGLFHPDSPYAPPPSLEGSDIQILFNSPLDRLRKAEEGVGTLRTMESAYAAAQHDPSVLDNFDFDEMQRGLADINGMPQRFLRTKDDVAQLRAQRAEQAEAQESMANAQAMAETMNKMAPAVDSLEGFGANADALAETII